MVKKINFDIMDEFLSRKQLFSIGALSLVVGLVFFVISIVFISNTLKSVASNDGGEKKEYVSQDVCLSSLRGIRGLNTRPDGGKKIILSAEGLENAALKLGEASAASLVCPGWELSSFCMGESCENGEGLLFELQVID